MNDELYHFGIPGMKWGIRRYRNEDGTLTPAGIRRYSKDGDETGSRKKKKVDGRKLAAGLAIGAAGSAAAIGGVAAAQRGLGKKGRENWEKMNTPSVPGDEKKRMKTPLEKMTRSGSEIAREGSDMARTAARIEARTKRKRRRSYKSLSDDELRRRINRLQMERQYESLTQEETRSGFDTAADVLSLVGNVAAISASAATIYGVYKGMNKNAQ